MTREKFFKACTSQAWYWVKKTQRIFNNYVEKCLHRMTQLPQLSGWHSWHSQDNTAAAAPVAVSSFFCHFFVVKACLNRARQPPRTRPLRFPTPGFPLESSQEPPFIQNALIRAVTVGNVCCRAPSHENGNNFPSIFLFLCLFKITTAFIV